MGSHPEGVRHLASDERRLLYRNASGELAVFDTETEQSRPATEHELHEMLEDTLYEEVTGRKKPSLDEPLSSSWTGIESL